jgi:hypothetical protein
MDRRRQRERTGPHTRASGARSGGWACLLAIAVAAVVANAAHVEIERNRSEYWLGLAGAALSDIDQPAQTIKAHGDMAIIQAELGDLAGVRASAAAVRKTISASKLGPLSPAIWLAIPRALTRAGDAAGARATVQALARNQAEAVGCLTQVAQWQIEYGDAEGVDATLAEAHRLAAALKDPGEVARAACALTEAEARAGHPAAAQEALLRAQSSAAAAPAAEPGPISLACRLALAGVAVGDTNAAKSGAAALKLEAERKSVYVAMAKRCSQIGDTNEVRRILRSVKWEDPRLEAATQCAMAAEQFKNRDRVNARLSIQTAKDAISAMSMYLPGKTRSYLQIAQTQVAGGDPGEAKTTLGEIEGDCLLLAGDWAELGRLQFLLTNFTGARHSFEVAKRMAAGMEDADNRAATYAQIAWAQANADEVAGAKATLGAVPDPALRKDTCRAIGSALARSGELADLERWVATLPEPRLRVEACLGAAAALAQKR